MGNFSEVFEVVLVREELSEARKDVKISNTVQIVAGYIEDLKMRLKRMTGMLL